MKKEYIQPEVEIGVFSAVNVFTESNDNNDDDGTIKLPFDEFT